MRLSAMLAAALCGAGLLAMAETAVAQAQPGAGAAPTQPQPRGMAAGRPTSDEYRTRMERDGERLGQGAEMTVEEAEARYGADRVALAEQVQSLIEAGRCEEARRMAVEAGERSMALRVRQTCRRRR